MGTNGYLLKKEHLDDILPALTYLRFNISAAEPLPYSRIHGCPQEYFYKVVNTVKKCVKIKKAKNLTVTIGLQMVLIPGFSDQIIPLSKLGRDLEVDYLVIKHCSDDENASLGIDYSKYYGMIDILKTAESFSTENYSVKVKWSKILSAGRRRYSRCYGAPFILQISGSGLVAPCGMLFNNKHKKYHIGNIIDTPFKEIWEGKRYLEVLSLLASDKFNTSAMCGTLCLQHNVNEFLWDVENGSLVLEEPQGNEPLHINFI